MFVDSRSGNYGVAIRERHRLKSGNIIGSKSPFFPNILECNLLSLSLCPTYKNCKNKEYYCQLFHLLSLFKLQKYEIMFVYLYEYKKKGGKVTFPFISNLIVILHD